VGDWGAGIEKVIDMQREKREWATGEQREESEWVTWRQEERSKMIMSMIELL
jgi:hypothetical protein